MEAEQQQIDDQHSSTFKITPSVMKEVTEYLTACYYIASNPQDTNSEYNMHDQYAVKNSSEMNVTSTSPKEMEWYKSEIKTDFDRRMSILGGWRDDKNYQRRTVYMIVRLEKALRRMAWNAFKQSSRLQRSHLRREILRLKDDLEVQLASYLKAYQMSDHPDSSGITTMFDRRMIHYPDHQISKNGPVVETSSDDSSEEDN